MIDGFVVIDKPAGITSHGVVARVRRILGTRKVGHTGTLDPFATGVLPVAVNDGTKAIPFLDEGTKVYEAVMQLGLTTDTLDTTGAVVREADWGAVTLDGLTAVLAEFTGQLSQVPPMYSAIKRDGQPLYKLARQGRTVERDPRRIEIFSLALGFFDPPLVSFRVVCSRGTYVRTLADDIGRRLGCGAALKELRRTASGTFSIAAAVSLEELEEAAAMGRLAGLTVSPSAALAHLSELRVGEGGLACIAHGRVPSWDDIESAVPGGFRDGDLIRLTRHGELLAVAQFSAPAGSGSSLVLKRVFL